MKKMGPRINQEGTRGPVPAVGRRDDGRIRKTMQIGVLADAVVRDLIAKRQK